MPAHSKLLVLFAVASGVTLFAQQGRESDDAEKRRLFLKAREEMRTVPATPAPEATPKPKPKPRAAMTPEPKPEPTPRPKPVPEPEPTPRPKPKPEPATPPRTTPPPVTPKPVTPLPKTPAETPPPADVTVEKKDSQDIQPAPPVGWWERWKYLSRSVRAEIDRAHVRKGRWRYIAVHNSGTRQGNARAFEYYHRRVRHMKNGLAYHFVIGNGSSSGDGEIEIGNRWRQQLQGGQDRKSVV